MRELAREFPMSAFRLERTMQVGITTVLCRQMTHSGHRVTGKTCHWCSAHERDPRAIKASSISSRINSSIVMRESDGISRKPKHTRKQKRRSILTCDCDR